jgi:hypothetical protein
LPEDRILMSLSAEDRRLFEESLHSGDPVMHLSDAVRGLLKSGKTRQDLLAELEEYRTGLPERGRGLDEDVVLEIMDFLTGWASPYMKNSLEEAPPSSG